MQNNSKQVEDSKVGIPLKIFRDIAAEIKDKCYQIIKEQIYNDIIIIRLIQTTKPEVYIIPKSDLFKYNSYPKSLRTISFRAISLTNVVYLCYSPTLILKHISSDNLLTILNDLNIELIEDNLGFKLKPK